MLIRKKEVDKIFKEAENQSDYVIELHKLLFPDWEQIDNLNGFPQCGVKLSKRIWDNAIDFDKKHHKAFAGGLWLNNGWSTNSNLKDWEANADNCKITYL